MNSPVETRWAPISPLLEGLSLAFEKNVLETDTVKHSANYAGIGNKRRYYIGYQGELAFVELLFAHGWDFRYKPEFNGRPDEGDFIVWPERPLRLDVKTASEPSHKMFVLSESRRARHKSDIYIAARLHRYAVEFCGWLTQDEVDALPVGQLNGGNVPCAWCPFTKMHPMEQFWSAFALKSLAA